GIRDDLVTGVQTCALPICLMDLRGKRLVVIGGAGLIGSHTVDLLAREDVREIVIYDNFVRGTAENLAHVLGDPRVKLFEVGGDKIGRAACREGVSVSGEGR